MKKVLKTLKKYLIPHEANDHKPHLLRSRTVVFVCMVALVVESVFLFGSSFIAPRSKLFGIILVSALVDGTNQARTTNSIGALHVNALLQAAAQEKADDMVKNNYFAHTSPAGLSPWYWFENVGYNFVSAGENLAVNFSDSQDVTNAWLNSPEHRANILNAGFTEIGMATAEGQFEGRSAIYVVELFGTPAATSIVPFINTATAAAGTGAAPAGIAGTGTTVTKPKPAPKPVVVATGSEATFVVVKGAEIQAVPAAATPAAPVSAPAVPAMASVPQEANIVQKAAAAPHMVVDYLYFALAAVFAAALILNIFIKVRIQYPQLIFGGMLVVVTAGLLIVLNHSVLLFNATIL